MNQTTKVLKNPCPPLHFPPTKHYVYDPFWCNQLGTWAEEQPCLLYWTHLLHILFICYVFFYIYIRLLARFLHQEIIHILLLPDADVLIIMVTNEAQAESVLYGEYGAVSGVYNVLITHIIMCLFNCTDPFFLHHVALPPGATIILSSTVSPAYVSQLEHRLHSMLLLQWDGYLICI